LEEFTKGVANLLKELLPGTIIQVEGNIVLVK
jgi:hypothetical protein